MKKIVTLLLAAILALGCTACASSGSAKSSPVKNWLETLPASRYSPGVSAPRTVSAPAVCS